MGLDEQWLVLKSKLPADLKQVAQVLAMIYNPKKVDNIFVGVDELAELLGLHRVTVSRRLAELDRLKIFPVVRRGGRRFNQKLKKVDSYTTKRRFNPAALEQDFSCSRATTSKALCSQAATWSDDHVAASLLDTEDHVATSLHGPATPCSRVATNKETRDLKKLEREKETRAGKLVLKDDGATPKAAPHVAADSNIRRIIAAFSEAFLRQFPDKQLLVTAGKDGTLVKALLATYGADEVLRLIGVFFADPALSTFGCTIGSFHHNAARLHLGAHRLDARTAGNVAAAMRAVRGREERT